MASSSGWAWKVTRVRASWPATLPEPRATVTADQPCRPLSCAHAGLLPAGFRSAWPVGVPDRGRAERAGPARQQLARLGAVRAGSSRRAPPSLLGPLRGPPRPGRRRRLRRLPALGGVGPVRAGRGRLDEAAFDRYRAILAACHDAGPARRPSASTTSPTPTGSARTSGSASTARAGSPRWVGRRRRPARRPVPHWLTLNEINGYAVQAYVLGTLPPGRQLAPATSSGPSTTC